MTVTEMAPATQPVLPAEELPSTTKADQPTAGSPLIEDELLVEEISIDGMCGVY
ncbi:MAG TPA: mycofactocin precursor MftA [Acidimicrobiales bacterium]|nr:mycofactocin precursor MftA [Acidimicrobiales bacterium]